MGEVAIKATPDLFEAALKELDQVPEVKAYLEQVIKEADAASGGAGEMEAKGWFDSAKKMLSPLLGSASSMLGGGSAPAAPSGVTNPYQATYGNGKLGSTPGSNPFAGFMGGSGGSGGSNPVTSFLGSMMGSGGGSAGGAAGGLSSLIGGLTSSGGSGGGSFSKLGELFKLMEAGAEIDTEPKTFDIQ